MFLGAGLSRGVVHDVIGRGGLIRPGLARATANGLSRLTNRQSAAVGEDDVGRTVGVLGKVVHVDEVHIDLGAVLQDCTEVGVLHGMVFRLKEENGGEDRTRTCDRGIMSPMLYQLSYLSA